MELFNETSLLLKLEGMPAWKRVAFMAYCCERMLPNYKIFKAQTGYGDNEVLRITLDAIWEWIKAGQTSGDLAALAKACELQAPDTSEFSSPYTSAALDAATAIAATAEAVPDTTASQVIDVASLARDTIDLFVQEIDGLDPNDPGLVEKIQRSDLMQSELRAQRQSLEKLKGLPDGDMKPRAQLREQWTNLDAGSLPVG